MIERRPVTAGLKALLAALTGRPVGVRTVPLDANGHPVAPPYTLLYPLDHLPHDDALADRHASIMSEYQATFVSGPLPGHPDSRGGDEQAQWMTDRGWKAVARPTGDQNGYLHPIDVGEGVHCWHREAREAGGTSDPNDAIITSVIRFRLFLEETGA